MIEIRHVLLIKTGSGHSFASVPDEIELLMPYFIFLGIVCFYIYLFIFVMCV